MRRLILIAALFGAVQLPIVAHAQSESPSVRSGAAYSDDAMRGDMRRGDRDAMARSSMGENCGTPDEPKRCPPLPAHPLKYYPGDRPWKG